MYDYYYDDLDFSDSYLRSRKRPKSLEYPIGNNYSEEQIRRLISSYNKIK